MDVDIEQLRQQLDISACLAGEKPVGFEDKAGFWVANGFIGYSAKPKLAKTTDSAIRIDWSLLDDKNRKNKRSKAIILLIPYEHFEDNYFNPLLPAKHKEMRASIKDILKIHSGDSDHSPFPPPSLIYRLNVENPWRFKEIKSV